MFDYFRQFIHSLSSEKLARFLCFVTGFSVCSSKKITIQFNSLEGFQRRLTANTGGMVLHLPVSYESYSTFTSKLIQLLSNRKMWYFDLVVLDITIPATNLLFFLFNFFS